jgi:small subunit ribosomal protein S15Ae
MLAHPSASGYIGEVEIIDDRRAGKVVVNLIGRLNKCGVISPRFDVGLKDIEKWTNNLLPSRQFGKLVLTTSAGLSFFCPSPPPPPLLMPLSAHHSLSPHLNVSGIMDHNEARRKSTGGKILGFFY